MQRKQWETYHRWEWFQREKWRYRFREDKGARWGGSPAGFKRIMEKTGGKLALDASCGLGLKTIMLGEMGIDVMGSDKCEFAVEKARELSKLEGLQIEFFTSRWAELPSNTRMQFDAIFNDALLWTATREQLEASLRGLRAVLKPKGVLVFFGAPESDDEAENVEKLEECWESKPRFSIEWTHSDDEKHCTSLLARERAEDYIDEHHIYLIEEYSEPRLESATIRQPFYWHRPLLEKLFAKAGFSSLQDRTFHGMGKGGTDFTLNIATK
jgi:SAM-dependent methyltransferase